jgi:hypothetical protein
MSLITDHRAHIGPSKGAPRRNPLGSMDRRILKQYHFLQQMSLARHQRGRITAGRGTAVRLTYNAFVGHKRPFTK